MTKKILVTFLSIFISISAVSQSLGWRKDDRPQNVREDVFNEYQSNLISSVDILRALDLIVGASVIFTVIICVFTAVGCRVVG